MLKIFLQDIVNEHEGQERGDSRKQGPYKKDLFVILRHEG
jgi:hypothetical protein